MGVNPKASAKLQVFSDIRASFHYFFCLMTISEKFFAKNLQVSNISRTFAPAIKQHSVGAIAQLVEQRTENPCVPGSIPGGTTWVKVYGIFLFIVRFVCPVCIIAVFLHQAGVV